MRVKGNRTWMVWTLAVLLAAPFVAVAGQSGQCVKDEKSELADCTGICRETFQTQADICKNLSSDCVNACRTTRTECLAVPLASLGDALAACSNTLEQAKATCRQLHAKDPTALDACLDQAQGTAFSCRDAAREANRPAIRACQKTFVSCVQGDPTASPAVPGCLSGDKPNRAEAKACLAEAKVALKECAAVCIENFQFGKDECRNVPHPCMEACRADRSDCLREIEIRLDPVLAVCSSALANEAAQCKVLYPKGTPERDACIDQAQLSAFECRDAAREAEKGNIHACREAFRNCTQKCKPAP